LCISKQGSTIEFAIGFSFTTLLMGCAGRLFCIAQDLIGLIQVVGCHLSSNDPFAVHELIL